MNVVITNSVALNGGDAAILFAIVRLVREKLGAETVITVLDADGRAAREHYPELDIRRQVSFPPAGLPRTLRRGPFKRLWRAHLSQTTKLSKLTGLPLALSAEDKASLDALTSADLVISTGGTYLVEAYDVRPRLLELELASSWGKPVVLYTQSIDAFERNRFRRRVARALGRASLVLLRDERSRDHVVRMGVHPQRCVVCSDVVFALAEPDAIRSGIERRIPARGPRVVVSVRSWSHFTRLSTSDGMDRYRRAVAEAITWLVMEKDARVEMVSTCQGAPAYQADDSRVAREIVDSLDETVRRRVSVDGGFHTPGALLERLRGADLVIATRMHMAILALCAGVPVLPIAYEFKTEELFSALDRGDWVSRIDELPPGALVAKARKFLDEVDEARAAMFAGVERMRDSARSSIDHVAAVVRQRESA